MLKSPLAAASLAVLMQAAAGAALAQPAAPTAAPPAAAPVEHADWSKGENWLCKPGRQDACAVDMDATVIKADGSATVERFKSDPNAPIDCFYVYPTVSTQPFTTSDLRVTADERMVVLAQAARLSAHCKLYAPMYRQTTLNALRANAGTGTMPPARGARGQGPVDVADAWNYYLEHDNHGRGVILLGHSQGAGVIARLAATEIDGKPAQSKLVSLWVIGGVVNVAAGKDVGGSFKSIPACRKASQTGCVVTYGSFQDTLPPPATGGVGAGRVTGDTEGLCVNPAALAGGKGTPRSYWDVPQVLNSSVRSAPQWSPKVVAWTPFASTPGLISTECVKKNGRTYLEVHVNDVRGDVRSKAIPGNVVRATGDDANWGLHNVDMNHSMGSFVDLADAEGRAWVAAHGRK